MVEVFKTNVLEAYEAERITRILSEKYPRCKVTFDLTDCDKILRIAGENFVNESIISLLAELNYFCKVLD